MVPRWALDHVRHVDAGWRPPVQSFSDGGQARSSHAGERDVLHACVLAGRESRRRRPQPRADRARAKRLPGRRGAGVGQLGGWRHADAHRADARPRLATFRAERHGAHLSLQP